MLRSVRRASVPGSKGSTTFSSALVHRRAPLRHYHRGRVGVAGTISLSDQTTALGWTTEIKHEDGRFQVWISTGKSSHVDASPARFDLNMLGNFIRRCWQDLSLFLTPGTGEFPLRLRYSVRSSRREMF